MTTSKNLQELLNLARKSGVDITIRLTNDAQISELNREYLGRNNPTDVLSFDLNEETAQGYVLGEVAVNVDQAQRQSAEYGNSVEEEISELAAHGILHLLGVHHPDDDDVTVHGIDVSTKK
jgi:probable rRNA maturation factor